ncbi:MAG: hypothetical protein EOO88_11640 [Pedobacter sp.]|nr:MAG: hypothetical protein EOO88_11640 [Pedobacter sp.]
MKKEENKNMLSEPSEAYLSDFAEGELQLLKDGLSRTYKERFEFATRLYKIHMTMKNASISHKPFIKK